MSIEAPSIPPTSVFAKAAHSRAFEVLTHGNYDDVVGLLAYALYKKAIWEAASSGTVPTPGPSRNPQVTEVLAYRSAAERQLQKFAAQAVDDAKPDILDTAILNELSLVKNQITSSVEKNTRLRLGILAGVIAWMLSLGATWLIVKTLDIDLLQILGAGQGAS